MKFVIDLDDTVCDTDGYSEKYIKKSIKKLKLPYKFVSKVARFAEAKFDWDNETALKWYLEYGDQMMLEFPVKKNAVKVINKLYDGGHTIIISTARSNDWHVKPEEITHKWIEKVGLKYHKIYIGRNDKEEICKTEDADVFIDDDIKITAKVKEYFKVKEKKGYVFLSSTLYNETLNEDDGVIRVKSFKDMYKILEKDGMIK